MNWFAKFAQTENMNQPGPTVPVPPVAEPGSVPAITPTSPFDQGVQPDAAEEQLPIFTRLKKNPYGSEFFEIYGDGTKPIKDELYSMKFKPFRNRKENRWYWSKKVFEIQNDIATRQRLEQLGVDTSILPDPIQKDPQQGSEDAVKDTDKTLMGMKAGVEKAIKDAIKAGDNIAASMLDYVEEQLEKLANQVDDTAAQDFIKRYLDFAARFYNYSFGNQILIMMQKPDAVKVAGATAWEAEYGRRVTDPEAGIHILAPIKRTSKKGLEAKKEMSPEQWAKEKRNYEYMKFIGVQVFDYSDTAPIEGWTDKETGTGPFEIPENYEKDTNEEVEELTNLVEAAIEWGSGLGIGFSEKELSARVGGYSSGGDIVINSASDGLKKFTTVVHELAHEILHQTEEGMKNRTGRIWTKQDLEIDAEATAYVVAKHFGYESQDAASYIALWRAKGEDVRRRKAHVATAVKTIVNGLNGVIARGEELRNATY